MLDIQGKYNTAKVFTDNIDKEIKFEELHDWLIERMSVEIIK